MTPTDLAVLARPLLPHAIVGFDVDGVVAPIVQHADDSALLPSVRDWLVKLTTHTEVAILSGRSLDSLERLFHFPAKLHVIGSHGLEVRGGAGPMQLDDHEQHRIDRLVILGTKAVEAAGAGAWLEHKPASVVLHTRAADPALAERAVDALTQLATMIDGTQVKTGHHVLELLARSASKGEALLELAARLGRSTVVFFGDDLTDEDVFRMMRADDISVRVGPGETAARFRLAGPADVAEFLRLLVEE